MLIEFSESHDHSHDYSYEVYTIMIIHVILHDAFVILISHLLITILSAIY